MSNLITIPEASRFEPVRGGLPGERRLPLRASDSRTILADLRRRPLPQRAFLKKLLQRAAMNRAAYEFPVPTHAVSCLVDHT